MGCFLKTIMDRLKFSPMFSVQNSFENYRMNFEILGGNNCPISEKDSPA